MYAFQQSLDKHLRNHNTPCVKGVTGIPPERVTDTPPPRITGVSLPLRIVLVGSKWDKEDEIDASGQYRFEDITELGDGFPSGLRIGEDNLDGGGETWFDAYDAIWGKLSSDDGFELLKIISISDLDHIIKDGKLPNSTYDILVVGDWVSTLVNKGCTYEGLMKYKHDLEVLELRHQITIFPPIGYVWRFADKLAYLNRLIQLPLPERVEVMPSTYILKRSKSANAMNMTEAPNGWCVKRAFSGCCDHVTKHQSLNTALRHIKACDKKAKSEWPYLVQEQVPEFQTSSECKMFVLSGECTFGALTRDNTTNHHSMKALRPGTKLWTDIGQYAAELAVAITAAVRMMDPGAGHFIRVDMLCLDETSPKTSTWILNELEYFGDTHIPFDLYDNADERLEEVCASVKQWVLTTLKSKRPRLDTPEQKDSGGTPRRSAKR
jgi:hypothetical protein